MVQVSTVEADIDIKGNISGQFIVGNNNVQIQDPNGCVINIAPPRDRPSYSMRSFPVKLWPSPFPSLLDRNEECESIRVTIQTSTPVSIFGEEGIGKTSFLRRLIHLPSLPGFPAGVVYLDVSGRGLDDLLQSLFDAFYESLPEFKPRDAEIRFALQELTALVLLDGLDIARDEIVSLLNAAPNCTFILSSVERSLWGEGQTISLQGLPENDALTLFQRELGRSLNEEEQATVKKICVLLLGHPLRILQAASLVHERSKPISELLADLKRDTPEKAVLKASLSTLSKDQENVLALLAAANGTVMPLEHLVSLSQDPNVRKTLQTLITLGLVQAHSPRYSLTGNLASSLATLWDLSPWEDTLLNYFVTWLEEQPAQSLIEDSADALIYIVKRAGEKGRWQQVIRLGRALEHSLIIWKRWQAWLDILNLILKAAKELGDRKMEAWALHQLGSRGICLGQTDQARELLTQALNIRKSIKDKAGMKITQHNLDVLLRAPIPPKGGKPGGRSGSSGVSRLLSSLFMYALIPYVALSLFIPPESLPFPALPIYLFPVATPVIEDTITPVPTEVPIASEVPQANDIEGPQITDHYREPAANWVCLEDNSSVAVYSTVTDQSGVASATVEYQFNDTSPQALDMQNEGDIFTAVIDNLQEGLFTYKISSTDNGGNFSTVEGQDMSVFRCEGLEPYKDLPDLNFPDTGTSVGTNNLQACHQSCIDNNACMAFTYVPADGGCWLKSGVPDPVDNPDLISGVVRTPMPAIEIAIGASGSSERVMLYQGEEEDYFQVPVFITFNNQGNLDINEFDVLLYYGAYDGSHPTKLKVEGQNSYQDFDHISSLPVGESIGFEAKAMVPRSYEGTAVELTVSTDRCEIDVECQIVGYTVQLPTVVYDFIDSAPTAKWYGRVGPNRYPLEFNGSPEDCSHGLVRLENGALLEDGSQPASVLFTHPPCEGGIIQGNYDMGAQVADPGNWIVARVGFINGESGDGVTFRIDCITPGAIIHAEAMLNAYDSNEGNIKEVVIPLSDYPECAGPYISLFFSLEVDAGPTPDWDWAVWIAAYIERP